MAEPLFLRNTIAILWDFDNTLIPGNMQRPLFAHYAIDEQGFWDEVNGLSSYYEAQGLQVSQDTLYLNHMLTYVREGKFPGLNNALLKELGGGLQFHPGVLDFLPRLKEAIENDTLFKKHGVTVEHYVISTGLRKMIHGSAIAPHLNGVWACEFVETPAPSGYLQDGAQQALGFNPVDKSTAGTSAKKPKGAAVLPEISQIVFQIDNTTKTRAVFEINKGTNVDRQISVNATISRESRRVPFRHMIYIADGPSDIPVYSILNQYDGRTFAVYDPENNDHFSSVYQLQEDQRVNAFGPADYRPGSHTHRWILHTAQQIATGIVADRERALLETVKPPPGHVRVRPEIQHAEPQEGLLVPDETVEQASAATPDFPPAASTKPLPTLVATKTEPEASVKPKARPKPGDKGFEDRQTA